MDISPPHAGEFGEAITVPAVALLPTVTTSRPSRSDSASGFPWRGQSCVDFRDKGKDGKSSLFSNLKEWLSSAEPLRQGPKQHRKEMVAKIGTVMSDSQECNRLSANAQKIPGNNETGRPEQAADLDAIAARSRLYKAETMSGAPSAEFISRARKDMNYSSLSLPPLLSSE